MHAPPRLLERWNVFQTGAAVFFNAVENALVSWESVHARPRATDPSVQLAGNFSPVEEHSVSHNLDVEGVIPECINGVYLRNGANPLHAPLSGHHLFDGDGMIHAVTFNGTVSYACRFTQTERLMQEKEVGRPVFPKAIGELHGHGGIARLLLFTGRVLCGLLDFSRGGGAANAGLVYFNRRILALSEDDLPYHVRVTPAGDLQTVGRYDFSGQLSNTMTAHTKIDPDSGELFALSYDVAHKPYLKTLKFSADGNKSLELEIPMKIPTMTHDFAITENFVVIPDHQIVFKLQEMIIGGSPVMYEKDKVSRFGILSKTAQNGKDINWVNCHDSFCFHLWNAWEEPEHDEVVVVGSCMTPPDIIFRDNDKIPSNVLSEFRLNLKTGACLKKPIIKTLNLEAGTVNRRFLGRKTRYAYLSIAEPWPKVSGMAKVDLQTGEHQMFQYGDRRFGGEPLFVSNEVEGGTEDEGYVLALVHDEKTCKSELQIINAASLKLEASVKLPSRVPYGFHGTFLNSKDLENQI